MVRQETQVSIVCNRRGLAPQSGFIPYTRDKFLSFTSTERQFRCLQPHNIGSVLIHTSYAS